MQNLETHRLNIAELEETDLEKVHWLHSTPEVDEFNTLGIPQTIQDTRDFLQKVQNAQKEAPRKSYTWKITLKNSAKFIGLAGFTLAEDRFRSGEIYYKLHPQFWGQGYATELAKGLILLGFTTFQLHRIEAGVATENSKSIRVLEKIGMQREGLHRKILPIRGEWVDNYHYAILEDDPRNY